MRIAELFKNKMTISFEVFPPKNEVPMDGILETLSRLYKFKPDFISCTCGAGGSKKGRNVEVCAAVIKNGNVIMPHITCIENSRDDIKDTVKKYADMGIGNILAVRGDIPAGWEGTRGDFSHADNFIGFLKNEFPKMCIAAAA
jgi:methylenetetrahydrofolate reductase (NADPH)